MRYGVFVLIIPALCAAAPASLPTLLDQGYRQMYNLQFADAHNTFHEWERQHPGRSETIFRALGNVAPSQLADRQLFDFASLGSRDGAQRADAHGWLAGTDSDSNS